VAAAQAINGIDLKRIAATDERSLEEITKFAESHSCPSPFQSGAMFKVYSKTKQCRPLGFIAKNDQGGILGSLVATTFMDAGVLVGKVVNHVSCRGGPLFASTGVGAIVGKLLISKLLDAAGEKSLYTRFYPMFDQPDQLSLFTSAGFSREDWLNYFVDLTIGKEALREKMSKHRRKGIRRAENLGLEVVDASSTGDIDTLYGLLTESHNQARIPLQDRSMFEAMQRILVPNNMAKMMMAFRGETPIAARVALTFSGVIYDWYAGSVPEAEEVNANEFLVWRLMTWGHESGYSLLDFGGAGLPEEEYGPREFKRRFGGQLVNLGRYTIIHKPKMLKLIQNLHKVRRRI
jgi:serine/alanine adding enzyme